MAGVAQQFANKMIPETQAERIDSADVDGENEQVPEADRHYHGQAAVWVFFESLHSETASEWPW